MTLARSTNSLLAPPPADIAAAVAVVRQQLAEAQALDRKGNSEGSRALARAAMQAAERLSYPALRAEAMAQHARLLDGSQSADAREEVEALYRAALAIAEAAQHVQLVAMIWSRLVLLAIQLESGTQEAQTRWAHLRAVPSAGDLAYEQARRSHLQGEIYYRDGKYSAAARAQRSAIKSISTAPDYQLERSRYHDALAKALRHQGKLAEAVELHERAIELAATILDRSHPDLLKLRMNHGLALCKVDRKKARSVLDEVLGYIAEPDRDRYLDAGIIQGFLSELSYAEGEPEEASTRAQRSLQVYLCAKAPHHRMAEAYTNIGNADLQLKQFEHARASYELALAHRLGYLHENHHQIGVNHGSLAEALVGLARHDEAMVHVHEAQRVLGPSSDPAVQAWLAMVRGEVLIGQGKPDAAVVDLEGALTRHEAAPDQDPSNHACTAWALARALRYLNESPERVKQLAEHACALFEILGEHERDNYLAVKRFLEEERSGGPPPDQSDEFAERRGYRSDSSQKDRPHVLLEPRLDDHGHDKDHESHDLELHAASGLR
jgi:tetratricopeptide (TPR) repeat protein